ncbi:MAG TPA: hypothetical protein VH912_03860 [Streptosporangiaceae bacterium]
MPEKVPENTDTWGRLVAWLTDEGWLAGPTPRAAEEPEPRPGPGDRPGAQRHREPAGLRLTEPERRLWAAYPTGERVDVTGADDRAIRAEVLGRLLLGALDPEPGCVAAVRLRGAHITGCLDISGGTVGCELRLEHCELDEVPDFSNVQARQIRFASCALPGFDGGGLRTDGYLSLSGSVINGQVKLVRARITGGFRMNGTVITNRDGWGLYAGALAVEAGTFWQHARITGGARLTGARMGGGFFLYGATLYAPGRDALDGQNIIVEDAMECSRGFTAIGTVKLRGARVTGTLSFDQASVKAPGRRALQLSHMQVDELILTWVEAVGEVSLVYSRVGVLLDGPEHWPAELRLNGLVYQSLRGSGVDDRLGWVNRDPRGFHPQPYEQLAIWYRGGGHEILARRAQLAKLRARRSTQGLTARVWSRLLDITVGYGYRPTRAAMWFALLLAVGTIVFAVDHPHAIKPPDEQPQFNPFAYTLDLLVPISAFGQRDAWDPVGWTQWLAYVIIAAGWLLATALIAGVTRVLRPN